MHLGNQKALLLTLEALRIGFERGPSHLHCVRAWDFWYGVGMVEGALLFVWGIKESIG